MSKQNLENQIPTIIEFHLITGKRLKLDLKDLRVGFKTASNGAFMSNPYEQKPEEIVMAIAKLKPEETVIIETETLEGSDLFNKTENRDRKRLYVTQRNKIDYVRVSYE